METGRLKSLVAIDRPIDVENTNGEPSTDWQEVTKVRARIQPVQGREFMGEMGPIAEAPVRIYFRWRPSLEYMTAKWRMRYRQTVYNLTDVPPFAPKQAEFWIVEAVTGG